LDRASDPLPLARELYSIVFPEGLRQNLESLEAHTIMWSIDGPLRYIPIAALHDGHDYLVKRFRNSLFTPRSMGDLLEQPASGWQGLGYGMSKGTAFFPALDSVPAELHGIFRTQGSQPDTGTAPVPGTVRLDEEFTRAAISRDLLQLNHRVVHIATHFDSRSSAESSQLLLGDGTMWNLREISAGTQIFDGVDLLTLSACSTAFTNRGEDGKEVDSLATLAQDNGARSVIASLWSVSDEATARLMQTMYRLLQQNPPLTKSEALRQAQEQMLLGTLHAGADAGPQNRGAIANRAAPSPAHRDWTHPYFWAPFILIGNWK
jgi:CHAT domain-containing protein